MLAPIMRHFAIALLFGLPIAAGSAQNKPPGIDPALAQRIHDEVAAPITSALPGWLVGDDPGAGSIETWDSKDARKLRLTLNYFPVGRSASAVLDRLRASFRFVPGTLLDGDPLARRVASDQFAEAVVLVQRPDESWTLYVQRVVALGDAYAPPILMATFSSRKGQTLDEFRAWVAARIRGLDPALDTFLMLGLKDRIAWEGEARVFCCDGARTLTFAAPEGWRRAADPAAIARWEANRATATIRARLGAEADPAAFAHRWLDEPCREFGEDNRPRVQASRSDDAKAQYCFVSPAVDGAAGSWHWVQVRGHAPLFLVYDVAVEVAGFEPDKAAAPFEAAVRAAFAATAEAAPEKAPAAPPRKEK